MTYRERLGTVGRWLDEARAYAAIVDEDSLYRVFDRDERVYSQHARSRLAWKARASIVSDSLA